MVPAHGKVELVALFQVGHAPGAVALSSELTPSASWVAVFHLGAALAQSFLWSIAYPASIWRAGAESQLCCCPVIPEFDWYCERCKEPEQVPLIGLG